MWTGLLRLTIALLTFTAGVGLTNLAPGGKTQTSTISLREHALVSELIAAEDALHAARLANDRAALQHVLADEFINIDQYCVRSDEAGFIRFVLRERFPRESYTASVPTLVHHDGDKATIEVDKIWWDARSGRVHFRDIDTFVRRDGRWQMLYSDSASHPFWVE